MAEKKEFLASRRGVNYLDLFAGAGGFSEGFMQAYTDDKFYDFRPASDINENCELTHRVRNTSGTSRLSTQRILMSDSLMCLLSRIS